MSHHIRRFAPADRDAMLAFANTLPEHDLLFLGRDLKHPRVVDAWQSAIEEGWIDSLIAEDGGEFVGTAALVRDPLGWSAHVGEIRLLVAPGKRGAGIGRDLLEAIYAVAMERGLDDLVWSRQNAEELSFPSRFFDAYTIAFGIRNVTHIDKALAEAHRVLKMGGRFYCLEFSTTEWPGFKEVYDFYSHKLVPQIGKAIAHDEDSYRYLIESIRRFPTMPEFEQMIRAAGFTQTRVEPILGGLVAIHSGWKT